ncbi:MAG: hypothetical protein JJ850_13365 [Kordiimonadaceae bacterium]|nr:hypothetical protein [Kordiimonadaceae bacterium]MBO6570299.1 hypothetical protein [Kordiimonadaceae bacterium]MBO6965603.1 hypothetical protein [Kordiimonadaceae bacterium]
MTVHTSQPVKPRFLFGAIMGGCVAGLISALGMLLLMFNTQLSTFRLAGASGAESAVLSPQSLLLVGVFFMSAFPVWFIGYATLGRMMMSYSISSGKMSVGGWTTAIILIGVLIGVSLNLSTQYQTMFSGPFLPAVLILSATLGFMTFWKKADPTNLHLQAKLQGQGLIGESDKPADWAIAAARRIAEKDE